MLLVHCQSPHLSTQVKTRGGDGVERSIRNTIRIVSPLAYVLAIKIHTNVLIHAMVRICISNSLARTLQPSHSHTIIVGV